jgi:hypothetical protein
MPKTNLDKYIKLIEKMERCNTAYKGNNGKLYQDTEGYHMEQDVIYRKFIRDIANGKITDLEEIVNLSKLLNNKVVKYDKDMWYG